MSCHPHRRWLLAIALAATGFGSAAVTAQLQDDAAQETIQIQAGDILEILPVHSLPSATYSWILTQDRNFIEVARSAFYNTRLTTPGRFTLNAEVNATAEHAVLRRVFAIDVLPRHLPSADTGAPHAESAPSAAPLASALPEPDSDGRIILPPRRELLLLTPLRSDILPLRLDLDARNDADDDGTLTNDDDNAGTFFQTSGTPLHLWFTDATEQRDITLHAATPDGTPLAQALSILPAEYARQRGLFLSRVLITTEERGPKTILFSPQFENGGAPAIPLVFHWDFGDGTESIEERPLHEFAAYGTYSVRLSVRNIETGKELAARTKAISLQAPLIHDQRSSLPAPAIPPEEVPPPAPRASFLRIAFVILGVAIGFASVGFAVAWAYRTAQAYLLKRKTVARPSEAPPPSSPPKTPQPPAPTPAAPPKPVQPSKAAPPPPAVSFPAIKKPAPAPVAPDWLKKATPSEAPPMPPATHSPKPPPLPPQPPTAQPSSPTLPKPPPPLEPKQQSPAPASPPPPPQPQPPAIPQPPAPPRLPLPPKPQQPQKVPPPAPPKKPAPPSTPPPESDRTVAIVQAENLPPPPKPPAPPSNPSSQSPKEAPHPSPLPRGEGI